MAPRGSGAIGTWRVGRLTAAAIALAAGSGGVVAVCSIRAAPARSPAPLAAQVLLLVALALIQCGAAWRARDEPARYFTAVTVPAAAFAALVASAAVFMGAVTTWFAWAVTADGTVRSIAVAWAALSQPAAAAGRWLARYVG